MRNIVSWIARSYAHCVCSKGNHQPLSKKKEETVAFHC